MSSKRRESYLRIAETDGNFAVMVDLAQQSSGERLQVPYCDLLTLALAKLLARADEAVAEAIVEVQQAYEQMSQEPDAVRAAELFNAAIGVDVYSVEPKQENAP